MTMEETKSHRAEVMKERGAEWPKAQFHFRTGIVPSLRALELNMRRLKVSRFCSHYHDLKSLDMFTHFN
jgi:hypothetical protein